MNSETLSPWGSTDIGFAIGLKIIPLCLSGGVKSSFLKNEGVMRKLVRCSCNVTSKLYGKKVDLSSAPPLQIAEYINSIKTKQENFELKLEQGNVTFQHIGNSIEDNELDKFLEVLKSRKGTSENKNVFVAELVLEDLGGINASIAHLKNTKVELMDFFVKQYAVAYGTSRGESAEFSNEKCESAVKQVKEYRCGLRQMMADGDSSVARSSGSSGRNVM